MASAFTHAFVALAAGKACYHRPMGWKFWLLAMACSAAPDLDVGLFAYGVEYQDLWGHRGMTHSLFFAAILAPIVVSLVLHRHAPFLSRHWWGLVAFFFAITASHGVIDALTNGGLGIAFFSPFDSTRYFFPWTPLEVAPIGAGNFFTRWGLQVMRSEFVWVWLPAIAINVLVTAIRMIASRRTARKHKNI